jgi:glutathione S-transferase
MYKLITIAISHYNEKARWGLDRFSLAYTESGYMPLLHFAPVAWATRGGADATQDRVSSRFSTPVLIRPEGEPICDSSRILRYLDEGHRGERPSLYSNPECEEFERDLHDGLGAHSRRLAYFYLLGDRKLVAGLARNNVGWLQTGLFRALMPAGSVALKRSLKIDKARAARSRDKILQSFDRINELLGDGRPYLLGDTFSAVDLSFACMAAPSLLVSHEEGYGAHLPGLDEVPEAAGGHAHHADVARRALGPMNERGPRLNASCKSSNWGAGRCKVIGRVCRLPTP